MDLQDPFGYKPLAKTTADDGYYFSLGGSRFGVNLGEGQLPQYALDINGTVRCTEVFVTSDEKEKCDIAPAPGSWCADKVSQLGVATFCMPKAGPGHRVGLIAQNVEMVLPSAVSSAPEHPMAIDTTQIVALLVGAVKTIQEDVKTIREDLTRIERRLHAVESIAPVAMKAIFG
jgi:hypothetical protein